MYVFGLGEEMGEQAICTYGGGANCGTLLMGSQIITGYNHKYLHPLQTPIRDASDAYLGLEGDPEYLEEIPEPG